LDVSLSENPPDVSRGQFTKSQLSIVLAAITAVFQVAVITLWSIKNRKLHNRW